MDKVFKRNVYGKILAIFYLASVLPFLSLEHLSRLNLILPELYRAVVHASKITMPSRFG